MCEYGLDFYNREGRWHYCDVVGLINKTHFEYNSNIYIYTHKELGPLLKFMAEFRNFLNF